MDLEKEKRLIENARKDADAFGQIFEENYSKILHYTLKRVGDLKLAEDITSEVFLKAFYKLWQFKWQNVPFIAWLFRIANNEVKMYFRKQKYKSISLETMMEKHIPLPFDIYHFEEEIRQAEQIIESHKNILIIQSCLTKLPILYQEALALKYFEQKKIREIAAILKKREGTVKSLLSRGLNLWKKAISEAQTQPKEIPRIIRSKAS